MHLVLGIISVSQVRSLLRRLEQLPYMSHSNCSALQATPQVPKAKRFFYVLASGDAAAAHHTATLQHAHRISPFATRAAESRFLGTGGHYLMS